MNQRLFWRSLLVQLATVGVLFAILALALDKQFFEDYGWIAGPLAWIVCSAISARLLSLPLGFVMFSALAGGICGLLVSLVAGHTPGLGIALLVFAAACSGYEGERDTATA